MPSTAGVVMEATAVGGGAGARNHDGCHAVLNAAVVVDVLTVAPNPRCGGEVVVALVGAVLAVVVLAVVVLGLPAAVISGAVCSPLPPQGAQDHLRVPLLQGARDVPPDPAQELGPIGVLQAGAVAPYGAHCLVGRPPPQSR